MPPPAPRQQESAQQALQQGPRELWRHEGVSLTSSCSAFPDRIKLIKSLHLGLLQLSAIASLDPRSRAFDWTLAARDSLIGGRISYAKEQRALVWRKSLPLPVLGGLSRPVLAAEWQLGAGAGAWRRPPRLQLGLAVDDGEGSWDSGLDDGAMLCGNAVAFRKKAWLTRRWGLEVDGELTFSLSHDLLRPGSGTSSSSLGLGLEAKQLSVVCRL